MKLKDKVSIVTGSASGFGKGIAELFAKEGSKVIIADINETLGKDIANQINNSGGKARFIKTDVSQRESMKNLIDNTNDIFGCLDILVSNAGWSYSNKPSTEVTEQDLDKLFNINIKSLFFGTIFAVDLMRRNSRGGVLINIASTAAVRPRPNLTWYNATKGAAVTITKSLAVELAGEGIRVCAINPVIGETGMLETFMGMPDTPENREKFMQTIPIGRFSKPSDIANAALFLAQDESNFLTGVCLEVDGGRCV
ncbi:MAG: 4-formylbenzenesulfonate dehydrogenase TsaC1/TsaC2 [Alphaproteobacteria bacterium MarineAlpha2_Bin1]|nr:MAG: 4-formylbenzenesulfonate dehydrogenase TsaC1/TsaC2 [Alphaproteobacteria bacterium MarineAlpha2_Bin1]